MLRARGASHYRTTRFRGHYSHQGPLVTPSLETKHPMAAGSALNPHRQHRACAQRSPPCGYAYACRRKCSTAPLRSRSHWRSLAT